MQSWTYAMIYVAPILERLLSGPAMQSFFSKVVVLRPLLKGLCCRFFPVNFTIIFEVPAV